MTASRPIDFASLILLPVMLVCLAGAVTAGVLQILWTGDASTSAATVSFVLAFIFGGAFLLALIFAAYEECHQTDRIRPTDPNKFGAEV